MDIKKRLGLRIKELRKMENLSQEKLSELADIAQNSLSNIETGEHFLTAETLEKLTVALKINASDLFDFEHIQDNKYMKEEILELMNKYPEKISVFYRVAKAIMK